MALSSRESEVYEFGPFRLDVSERLLAREGRPVPVAPKVFDTLVVLARGGGRLLTKDEMMAELWPDTAVEEANLVVNISTLRKVLGEGGGGYIETVPKCGYRLAAQVRASGVGVADSVGPSSEATPLQDRNAPATISFGEGYGAVRPARDRRGRGRSLITAAACGVVIACLASIIYLLLDRRAAAESHFQSMRLQRLTSTGNVGNAALSPDGNYFVYVLAEEEGRSLWVKQVTASNAVRILPPARGVRFTGLTFSADGESVYYVTADESGASALQRVPVLGGTAQRLLEDIDKPVTFSPGGERFAFVRRDAATGESKVLIARAGGEVERTLATRRAPASFLWLAWSPDGESIACSARDADAGGEYANVVELRLGDGSERPVSEKRWHWAGQLAWPKGGGGLLVAATDPDVGMHNQIWEVPLGGGRARRVTNDLNSYVGFSASADAGRLLAVVADRVSNIWIAPLDGGAARQVTAAKYDGYWGLSWMADGRLLYESSGANQIQFWLASADGAAQTQLTADPHPKAMPAASRDGRHIVFASARAGPMNLWRMGADGTSPRQLTFGREGDAYPALSPDGAWVVYEATQAGVPALWKVPLGGGDPTRLTGAPATRPAVSPCGGYVAYWAGDAAAGATVEVISSGGGEPLKRLTVPASPVGDRRTLRWVPAGGALSYVGTRSGVSNVWSVPLDGGAPRRLTDFRAELIFDFDWSPDGRSLALSRGNFTRDVVIINDLRLAPRRQGGGP